MRRVSYLLLLALGVVLGFRAALYGWQTVVGPSLWVAAALVLLGIYYAFRVTGEQKVERAKGVLNQMLARGELSPEQYHELIGGDIPASGTGDDSRREKKTAKVSKRELLRTAVVTLVVIGGFIALTLELLDPEKRSGSIALAAWCLVAALISTWATLRARRRR